MTQERGQAETSESNPGRHPLPSNGCRVEVHDIPHHGLGWRWPTIELNVIWFE